MFRRMLIGAAMLRRGRAASALLAMVVAATATSALLTLFLDVPTKLQNEFRGYGANIVLVAQDGQSLPMEVLHKTQRLLGQNGLAVPFGYVVARTSKGDLIVVSGTDLADVRKLDTWWSVTEWPRNSGDALLGVRAAAMVSPEGKPFDLSFQGHNIHLNATGTLRTGAEEDSRIYISMQDFLAWTGVQPSSIEVAASGSARDVEATIQELRDALPAVQVRPIRKIIEAGAGVLRKTKATLLAASIFIIATAALCLLATLTGWVLDRRRDFAIMKALGASQRFLASFFAAEAAILGAIGAVFGFVCGIALAAWIGRVNFNAAVMPRFEVFPIVLAGCIIIALVASIAPISLLRRLQPAMILKGE